MTVVSGTVGHQHREEASRQSMKQDVQVDTHMAVGVGMTHNWLVSLHEQVVGMVEEEGVQYSSEGLLWEEQPCLEGNCWTCRQRDPGQLYSLMMMLMNNY